MVVEMDCGVGEILDVLERNDIEGCMMVIFMFDNGVVRIGFNGLLCGNKGFNWEGGY